MKYIQKFLLLACAGLMCWSSVLHAEDIDIYVDNATTVGVPNVLFVLYNGADMDADAGTGCTYSDGSTPSTGGSKVISLIQCSLVSAIAGLANSSVNIGVAVNNFSSGSTQLTTDQTKGGYHDLCQSGANGGCIIRKLMTMDTAGKQSMTAFIKGIDKFNGGSTTVDGVDIKVNASSGDPASSMQEAWAYYNGKTGGSGKVYSPSILGTGCQRNFVVYIGSSAKQTTGTGNQSIDAVQVGASSAQLSEITGTSKFVPNICGVSSSALTAGNNWADEWARLMYQQDGGASGNTNTQNITTYAINVQAAPNKCFDNTPAMLSSMAKNGGGKFYDTSSALDLTGALNTILNEVQAVNSVFSSASLPVSVNAEGSYLNQIYLGMFRPDQTGAPRWMGNLKQYQLIENAAGATVLGDSAGVSAISSSGTGFISPSAVSFWSYKNTAAVPDDATTGGFWVNDKKGVPSSGYDSPDGEVVEKGGVGQQIRKENLTSSFAGAIGSGNPRRLYTYCPSGSSCQSSLTHVDNALTTANTGIASNAFGTTTTVKVLSIVRTGTSALVTTFGNHGFSTGTSVSILNAGQSEYNVTQSITANSSTTFTITVPDYPTSPSAGTYSIAPVAASSFGISSMTRTNTGAATETVTVVTSTPHGFTTTSTVQLSGVTTAGYNVSMTPTAVSTSSFTYSVTINPTATSTNSYTMVLSPSTYPKISNVTISNPSQNTVSGSTSSAHKLHIGQVITVGGGTAMDGSFTVFSTPTSTTFNASNTGSQPKNKATSSTATVAVDITTTKPIAVGKITRGAATGGTATATIALSTLPSGWFGSTAASGGTKVVNIVKAGGTSTNETAYEKDNTGNSNITITCLNAGCTGATYQVAVTPSSTIDATGATAAIAGSTTINLGAGAITRSGTTATICASGNTSTGCPLTASNFTNNQIVNIGASGSILTAEAAYVGQFTLSCSGLCTTATIPVTLTPATPATGSNIQAYSGSTAPDKDTVVKWVRGSDNYGDELGPGGTVTVRPSVHGDVLHSRPLVINYGDITRGIVVYYGANDGVYRATNGNQTAAINGVPAGGELWGLVLPEHYSYINRLRLNSPELKFPSTSLSTAQAKDYFVDGPTGSFQKVNTDGIINTAYIYLTMRRGGRFVYGLDVSTPTTPSVLFKKSNSDTGFDELGQTWSRPRATLVQGGGLGTTQVLIFGAGYDTQEDSEPPGTDSQGRGIFIVNAATGALVWSASPTCTTSSTCRQVTDMIYAIPSDIAVVDRDNNGYSDKLYFGDLGGNIWRADISDADTANWKVTKIAELGCDTGACASGTTPRKFFFPPSVLTVKASGASGSYDLISIASGDREHPLKSTASGSSYYVNDRFFTIKDTNTTVVAPTSWTAVKKTNLFNATSTAYDGSGSGFYMNFATAEKGVNAPLAVNGKIFFSTNRPTTGSSTCAANLGEAKAYAVDPFAGTAESKVLAGGGLPPSPVSGLVTITKTNPDGSHYTEEEKFCIGCAVGCADSTCNVSLENSPPAISIPKNLKRTYWYKK